MMQPQPITMGDYAWAGVHGEKIRSSEAATLRRSGIFEYEEGTKSSIATYLRSKCAAK